jgi:hypothetical protein
MKTLKLKRTMTKMKFLLRVFSRELELDYISIGVMQPEKCKQRKM